MLKNYSLLPNLIIRSPLLPIELLIEEVPIDHQIKEIYKNEEIQEAIYIASPELYFLLKKWLNKENDFSVAEQQKMLETFLKYFTRMCSRCTPFGLFAGIGLCQWDTRTSLKIDDYKKNKKVVRFDMMLINYITTILARNEKIKQHLKYYPNSSLHVFSRNYRYFEAIISSTDVKYNISEINKSFYIDKAISLASNGITINTLANNLTDNNVNFENASNFISDLIDSQILINELEPVITGEPYLKRLVEILVCVKEELGELPEEVENIFNIINDADIAFNSLSINYSNFKVSNYERISSKLKHCIPEVDQKFVFQVDLIKKHKENIVSNKLAGQVRQALEALNLIFPSSHEDRLSTFKQKFHERYEFEEVPLLQVLDNESGIGYPISELVSDISPIIDDILINQQEYKIASSEIIINKWLQEKYLNAILEDKIEIKITEEDLKDFTDINSNNTLPDTISVFGNIFKDQQDNLEKVVFKIAAGFATAASMLGRFTHYDKGIDSFVKSITLREKQLNKDKIVAEIVHLPQSRVGNVLIRSHLRDFEIPFLAHSTLPNDHIIRISDLYISISNDLSRIILKSKKLNKEILPRLSTAHNVNQGNQLPIYRFLCDLQYQGYRNPLVFSWDKSGIYYPFKPRVIFKNVILHKASWIFESKDLELVKIHIIKGDYKNILLWRNKWKIPKYVFLVENDIELFLNLDEPLFLALFANKIGKSAWIVLCETFNLPENCVITDINGCHYINEFIMAFGKNIENDIIVTNSSTKTLGHKGDIKKRVFPIGSEWIFFKIYLGFKSADEFLINYYALLKKYKKNKVITKWFFIRYADPQYHLRIRIKLSDPNFYNEVFSDFNKISSSKIRSGKISKIQLDTYKREIERYGDDSIEFVEEYFELQSNIIIDFLNKTSKITNQDLLRFLFAIKFLDLQLKAFGYTLERKKEFTGKAITSFEKEFQTNSNTKKQIRNKYEVLENNLDYIFEESLNPILTNWQLVTKVLNKYHNSQINLINNIRSKSSMIQNYDTKYYFIWSINHMFINKLARTNARKFEYIVYAVLDKYLSKLYYKIESK